MRGTIEYWGYPTGGPFVKMVKSQCGYDAIGTNSQRNVELGYAGQFFGTYDTLKQANEAFSTCAWLKKVNLHHHKGLAGSFTERLAHLI